MPLPRPDPIRTNLPADGPYGLAFVHAEAGRWDAVARDPGEAPDRLLEKVLHWLMLRDAESGVAFADLAAFITNNPDWPDRPKLEAKAEALLDDSIVLRERLAWFDIHPPATVAGYLAQIETLREAGHQGALEEAGRRAWQDADFTPKQQSAFIAANGTMLDDQQHWERLDRLLWLDRRSEAAAMLPLVPAPLRRLAKARILLRRLVPDVDNSLSRIPPHLHSDPGLLYERIRWRRQKEFWNEATELLKQAPDNPQYRGLWWQERHRLIRHHLEEHRFDLAYRLAANHRQQHGLPLAEARWLAGWIALRFAGKPEAAQDHFVALHEQVSTPISRARAAYWAGRAFEATNTTSTARSWYAEAATHGTTFYGQMAAQRTTADGQGPELPKAQDVAPDAVPGDLAATARALHRAGQISLTRRFLRSLGTLAAASGAPTEPAAAGALAQSLGHPDIAVWIARQAARRGIILIEAGYPALDPPFPDSPEPALTHAVIRQESNFDTAARSRSGALGMMQLMPKTAAEVARRLRTNYRRARLTRDPAYNIRLGTHYLASRLKVFDGDYILAVASYNAGTTRVREWIEQFGDPRDADVDVIDWIERVPLAETRNYIQRVLENLHIYRQRLQSTTSGWSEAADRRAPQPAASRAPDPLKRVNG